MTDPISTKPYLLRALYEWCVDNGYTPYIAVLVDRNTRVPMEYVRNGEIVLNIGPLATNKLKLGNEYIEFAARFGGVAREVVIPVSRVAAIYARENGQGMSFPVERESEAAESAAEVSPSSEQPAEPATAEPGNPPAPPAGGGKPTLRVVK